uniref:Deoxyribonuclease-1-like 1 n=1 Tax=Urocitellus parryii TaxID=9999 RepID=A0A8D2GM54_UROPR
GVVIRLSLRQAWRQAGVSRLWLAVTSWCYRRWWILLIRPSPSCFKNSSGEEGLVGLIQGSHRTSGTLTLGSPFPSRFDGSRHYSSLYSSRLGRSTYKEKYVYIYRSDKTQVLNSYQYEDEDDLFAREPFVAQFTLPSKILPSLVLVPLHTTPKDVEKELNALYNVFLDVSQRWQSKEVILLGDFNADCTSLPKKRLSQLLLRTEAGFHWVIPDGEDTTVRASTHCTYDRIVLHGEGCQSLLQAAAAFNFPKSFQLTEEEALSISDHYPVEVELNQTARSIQPLSLPTLLLLSLLLSLLPSQLDLVAHG